jgi:hypothetical protein
MRRTNELPVREQWLLHHAADRRHGAGDGSLRATQRESASALLPHVAALSTSGAQLVTVGSMRRRMRPVEDTPGDAAPTDEQISKLRESELLAAMDQINLEARKVAKITQAAIRIQCVIRMFVARRRFRLHSTRVKAEVASIIAQRNMRCAVAVQRCVRGLVCRLRYRRQREEEALAAMEAAKSKAKGSKAGAKKSDGAAGKGSSGQGLGILLSPEDVALQQNSNFIQGIRKYLGGALDEAIPLFEAQQRLKPEPVTQSMIDLVKRKRDGTAGTTAAGPSAAGTNTSGSAGAKPAAKPAPKGKGKDK